MGRSAILAGTGYEGRDKIIRKHCQNGSGVRLRRDPGNRYDPNAVAVDLEVPRLGGLLGTGYKQIGFLKKTTAKSVAKRMDAGQAITGRVRNLWAPDGRDHPQVTIELDL